MPKQKVPRRGRKNRNGAPKPPPGDGRHAVSLVLFADVMDGALSTRVDPRCCIPLTNIRQIVRSGVERLKAIFCGEVGLIGRGNQQNDTAHKDVDCNYVAGSDSPIVIALTGVLRKHVVDHFKHRKINGTFMTETQAREKAASRSTWYGVVDGMHRLIAINELIEAEHTCWQSFTWPVTVLQGGHDIHVLKQLARQQNAKHNATYFIETTFFDILSGLRQEADRLVMMGKQKPSSKQIAEAYDGSKYQKENTIKQTASTSLRLSWNVINVIGDIINSEHPELAIAFKCRDTGRTEEISSAVKSIDCRVYRNFVHISSLRSSTPFMNASGPDSEKNQINTLYRLRDVCRLHQFKPNSHRATTEEFEKATSAMKEARKFERLLEAETWPEEMETLKHNLLRTTKLDLEVMMNRGNDQDILPSLVSAYSRTCPEIAPLKLKKYRESVAMHNMIALRAERNSDNRISGTVNMDANINNHLDKNQLQNGNTEGGTTGNFKSSFQVRNANVHVAKMKESPALGSGGTSNHPADPVHSTSENPVPMVISRILEDVVGRTDFVGGNISNADGNGRTEIERDNPALHCPDPVPVKGPVIDNIACTDPTSFEGLNTQEEGKNNSEGHFHNFNAKENILPSPSAPSMNSERLATSDKNNEFQQIDYFKELGLKCYQMKWQEYDKTIRDDDSELYDVILTDPPYGTPQGRSRTGGTYENYIDEDEIKSLAQFAKRVLRPGGWFFAFVSAMNFPIFHEHLTKARFSVPEYPFVVMKDTQTMQEHRDGRPQNGCEFAIFAQASGNHVDNHKVDLRSPYHEIGSREKRKFACVSNVPVPKNKLLREGTRSPVLTEEKNWRLLAEILATFCPEGGSVLDPYAGTKTTAIAAAHTGRTCTVVEANAATFRLANKRLREYAKMVHDQKRNLEVDRDEHKRRRLINGYVSITVGGAGKKPILHEAGSEKSGRSVTMNLQKDATRDCKTTEYSLQNTGDRVNEVISRLGNDCFKGGDRVSLLINDSQVGLGILQLSPDGNEGVYRKLHGYELSGSQKPGQDLVAVYGFALNEAFGKYPYPYFYKGQEASPETLSGISGFFAWDLHSMKKTS